MIKLKHLSLIIDLKKLNAFGEKFDKRFGFDRLVVWVAYFLAAYATIFYFFSDSIVAYGDAESHLNIAKRIIHSITPGFAQLGGIWLPIPHIMMVPFVANDFLWRTGLAGSIVSGFSYVISSLYTYKLLKMLTKNKLASVFGATIFMTNPNVLYLQSTPMTEVPLLMFFTLSSYYFVRFLLDDTRLSALIAAAFFGFLATLSCLNQVIYLHRFLRQKMEDLATRDFQMKISVISLRFFHDHMNVVSMLFLKSKNQSPVASTQSTAM